jgi:hypothetical protein
MSSGNSSALAWYRLSGVVGLDRDEQRELERARLVPLVGERCVVRRGLLGRELASDAAGDERADRELVRGLAEVEPLLHEVVHALADGQPGVRRDDA